MSRRRRLALQEIPQTVDPEAISTPEALATFQPEWLEG